MNFGINWADNLNFNQTNWQSDKANQARESERESARSPPRETAERSLDHFWKASPNQPSEDSQEEVVSRESHT